jgi:hypothetical protein
MFRYFRLTSMVLVFCMISLSACVTPTASAPVPTETPPPGPTATATPGGSRIDSFTVSPAEAFPGDTVTLTWQTTGAFGVEIVKRLPNDTNGAILSGLPPSGETTVQLDLIEANRVLFILTATTAGDPLVGQVDVKVNCPRTWFFENGPADTCPLWSADQYKGQGAFQTFEHGQMILNGADGWVVVLFDDGAQPAWTRLYPDWKPGDPEAGPPELPPDGLVYPINQMRSVWASEVIPGQPPRLRLGWATAPEVPIDTNYQCDSDYFYLPEPKPVPCFVMGPNGTVIRLSSDPVTSQNAWEILP